MFDMNITRTFSIRSIYFGLISQLLFRRKTIWPNRCLDVFVTRNLAGFTSIKFTDHLGNLYHPMVLKILNIMNLRNSVVKFKLN